MDSGNLAGVVFVDLKKRLILLIIKFSVGSWNLMAFCIGNWPGLDPIYQIESSTAEQMESTRKLKISTFECLKGDTLVHSFFLFILMIYQEQ